ncbi:unnamed protein product [Ranitomeya imitator]|uniref:Uncharacterized protein n=1 Tax=Ranitomeya imitator TaxID=111125 RepID=A0ABN9M8Y1_9NEOB|nr:unnamed protein product [Ranitomeya imitator]
MDGLVAIAEDKNPTDDALRNNSNPVPAIPDPTATQEPLVGSQKRKARKTKITHLVRSLDGQPSSAPTLACLFVLLEALRRKGCTAVPLVRHDEKSPPSSYQSSCSVEETCRAELTISGEAGVDQNCSITQDIPAVSAFFSLAALAEVAAMENVHSSLAVLACVEALDNLCMAFLSYTLEVMNTLTTGVVSFLFPNGFEKENVMVEFRTQIKQKN